MVVNCSELGGGLEIVVRFRSAALRDRGRCDVIAGTFVPALFRP